jgi:polysaccharide export outer membrane protein
MEVRRTLLLSYVMLLMAGCATGRDATAPSQTASPLSSQEYRIGVADELEVNVWKDPDLSVKMPVRPDGMITMPLIGDIRASGRTSQELASAIRQKLAAYVRSPDVTVMITELRSIEYLSRVRVTGAVAHPISLPYREGMTALDAILEAGGTSAYASPDRSRILRRTKEGGTQVLNVHLGSILTDGDLSSNIYLQPGDVLSVPERLF